MSRESSVTSVVETQTKTLARDIAWRLFAFVSQAINFPEKDADHIMLTEIYALLKEQIPEQLNKFLNTEVNESILGLRKKKLSWQLDIVCQRKVSENRWYTNVPLATCFFGPVHKALTDPRESFRIYYTLIVTKNSETETVETELTTALTIDTEAGKKSTPLIDFAERRIYTPLL